MSAEYFDPTTSENGSPNRNTARASTVASSRPGLRYLSGLLADPLRSSQLPFIFPSVNSHWWGNFRLHSLIGLRSSGSISSWMSSCMASRE